MRTCSKCGQKKPPEAFLRTDGKGNRCKACVNEYTRAWYHKNLSKSRAYGRRKYAKLDYATKVSRYRKKRRRTINGDPKERRRNLQQRLKYVYKITIEEYEALRAAHDDLCAICRQRETRKKNDRIKTLALDHDHVTGEIRGFLCHQCNSGIGCFKDRPDLLTAAIDYLAGARRFKPVLR